ncbi:unnamed protein product, partial [Symbiodinium necroappetens]
VQIHFRLYEDQGKLFISHLVPERERLESLLFKLQPTRSAVGEAMAFCMEQASVHGAMLAHVLVASLTLPGLAPASVLARLFLISDVLFNSRCSAKGAARYRSLFEELLPDAFEKVGQWLPGQEAAEASSRSMLDAWRTWEVFPSVFLDGLEALLLSAIPPSLEACLAAEAEGLLRQKLERWASAEISPTEVRQGARCRGLANAQLPVARCRLRLCHCERYWHGRIQVPDLQEAEEVQEASPELMDVDDACSIDGDPAEGEEVVQAASQWPVLGLTEWPLGIGMDPGALPDIFEPKSLTSGTCKVKKHSDS